MADADIAARIEAATQLRRLDLPVTIVIGELRQRYFHRVARHVERLIARASLHSVRGGSHAVHIDSPSEVAARIE